jgi:lysophospholipase L1-like esterase
MLPVDSTWVSNDVIPGINRHLEEIAREYGAVYLDMFSSFVDAKGTPKKGYLSGDGVHLASTGYGVWVAAVERFLLEM